MQLMNIPPLIPVLVVSLLVAGCLFGAYINLNRKRIIDDLPTSKTQGVFIGLAELKGTAESESPLISYLAAAQCVQYVWQIDEHWQRTVTEAYHDAQGRTQTRSRTESGWTSVSHGDESKAFYLKDDTGVIRIMPEGARIQGNVTFNKTVKPSDALYYGKGPANAVANSTHERRFHEEVVPLHAMLYVLGQARVRTDIVAAEIAQDKDSPMFLISTRSEKQVSTGYSFWSWFFSVFGLMIAAAGGGWWFAVSTASSPGWQPFVIAAASYLILWALIWVWMVYNSIVSLHHRVEQGWSQVDVQLKRRNDLIPNLIHAVEGYRMYERETQKAITELRRQMEATPPGMPGPDFKGTVPLMQGTIERYPELKANEPFLKLQQSLVDTEQRIALARDYFNDVSTFYNTRLSIIPDRYVAALVGLRPGTLLTATDFERAHVAVDLAT